MKTKITLLISLILLILGFGLILCFLACNEGEDDSSDSAENDDEVCDDDTYTECEGPTHHPVILDYYLLVNGEIAEQPATVHLEDAFALAVEYEDEDCNLEGGYLATNTSTEGGLTEAKHVYPINNIGCSSAETGEPYYQELEPSEFQFDQQKYPLYFNIRDRCRLPAEKEFIEFTVVP